MKKNCYQISEDNDCSDDLEYQIVSRKIEINSEELKYIFSNWSSTTLCEAYDLLGQIIAANSMTERTLPLKSEEVKSVEDCKHPSFSLQYKEFQNNYLVNSKNVSEIDDESVDKNQSEESDRKDNFKTKIKKKIEWDENDESIDKMQSNVFDDNDNVKADIKGKVEWDFDDEIQDISAFKKPSRSSVRHYWDNFSTNLLIQGLNKYGIGKWSKIANMKDMRFNNMQIKDKFRNLVQRKRIGKKKNGEFYIWSPSKNSPAELI